MQFKYPELLYALFLLLIPIIIHLFQLRRFQKVDFTNVAFLKKVTIQTRKSSQLKKWITLLTRMLALACIIIAFAQPFTASKTALNTEKETVIYIDNSFSMQARGQEGSLLQRALQDLYNKASGDEKISWFTNNFSRKKASIQDFKNEILQVSYSSKQLSLNEVLLKGNQLFEKGDNANKRLILISDFQQKETFPDLPEAIILSAIQLKPVAVNSISIDSAYIASKSASNTQLKVIISSGSDGPQIIPVSLFNNQTLIAKTTADFTESSSNTVTFDIENPLGFKGKLEINEPNLPYDNTLFFSINIPKKLKVLSINQANSNFLQRLFDQPEFDYTQQTFSNLNYNDIPSQNFIILNELQDISASLIAALKAFENNGGSLCIIPSATANIDNYNKLLAQFGLGSLSKKVNIEKKITQIVFDHPLYKDVFEKRVVNFQYPKVNSFYPMASTAVSVLRFEDSKPFILQKNNTFFYTSSLDTENTNFKNSPLIVPTFYNMAQQSLSLPRLYFTVGELNLFAVQVELQQDEILKIADSTQQFIPLQQTKANKVSITTSEEPAVSGTYNIMRKDETLEHISYNYDRSESVLNYLNVEDWKGVETYSSIAEAFDTIAAENSITGFWKWFAIFALLFLILEMLILKFYK